jgi:hypothetical protein
LASDHLPPLGRPVAISYGIVIFTEVTGELVDREVVSEFYSGVTNDHVWGLWRVPTLEELVHTWPATVLANDGSEWWLPTIEDLRPARRSTCQETTATEPDLSVLDLNVEANRVVLPL